jgi:hypothetical protein
MTIPAGWTDHGEIVPAGIVEDFVVTRRDALDAHFDAHWVEGPSFQNERLHWGRAAAPHGPFERMGRSVTLLDTHTRIYRGRIDDQRTLVSAIWPGLPRIGIWLFRRYGAFDTKELFIPPEGRYHMAACNPCVLRVGDHYEVFFEGRGDEVRWSIYHATWRGDRERRIVAPEPFLEGAANPSLLLHEGRLYLYYSKHVDGGFSTRCMSRPAP